MKRKRRNHSPEFKAKVGLEALKGSKTTAELARQFEVHAVQICTWKKVVQAGLPGLFEHGGGSDPTGHEAEIERLRAKIGELTMELDWLKKKSAKLSL
jgi:transposase-like protein